MAFVVNDMRNTTRLLNAPDDSWNMSIDVANKPKNIKSFSNFNIMKRSFCQVFTEFFTKIFRSINSSISLVENIHVYYLFVDRKLSAVFFPSSSS